MINVETHSVHDLKVGPGDRGKAARRRWKC